MNSIAIEIYVTKTGEKPFIQWLESLSDKALRYRIKERLDNIRLGNLGDWKNVGNSVFELRFNFGSGYRIYFGRQNQAIILLLCGGDKSSQKKDIKRASQY